MHNTLKRGKRVVAVVAGGRGGGAMGGVWCVVAPVWRRQVQWTGARAAAHVGMGV